MLNSTILGAIAAGIGYSTDSQQLSQEICFNQKLSIDQSTYIDSPDELKFEAMSI